jgi:hypothetical protein
MIPLIYFLRKAVRRQRMFLAEAATVEPSVIHPRSVAAAGRLVVWDATQTSLIQKSILAGFDQSIKNT